MATNMSNLIKVARDKGDAIAGTWLANKHNDTGMVAVSHYSTHMFNVHEDDTVTPVSRGWGSMTDKKGVSKILANISGQSYADVYENF